MDRVIVDPTTQAKLLGANQKLEICDDEGRILGHFTPLEGRAAAKREPQISEEEIMRRLQQGGGRTLAEIMTDLERKA